MESAVSIEVAFRYRLTLLLLSTAVVLFVIEPLWGGSIDAAISDGFFRLRGPLPSPTNVAIVGIDDQAFQNLETQWPWPRSWYAELIEAIPEARLIVFDLLFDTKAHAPEHDRRFADALRAHGRTILAAARVVSGNKEHLLQTWIKPTPVLRNAAQMVANAELVADLDGTVRRTARELGGMETLGYAAARSYAGRVIDENMPDAFTINYRGPAGTIRTFSFFDVLNRDPAFATDTFRDKLVFVGLVSGLNNDPNRPDRFRTAVSRNGGLMSGVEIHANVTGSLLDGSYIKEPSRLQTRVAGALAALALGLFLSRLRVRQNILLFIGISVVALGLAYWLFTIQAYLLPVASFLVPLWLAQATVLAIHYYETARNEKLSRDLLQASELRIASILAAHPAVNPDEDRPSVKVFLSYSHRVEDSNYMAEIMDYVQGLQKEGIEFWVDDKIVSGDLWDQEIVSRLADTDIALALISQSYLDSEYCAKEVAMFLEKEVVILPVMLSPCDWQSHDWLKCRQFIPTNHETLAENYQEAGKRQRVLLQIRTDLRAQAEKLRGRQDPAVEVNC